VVYGEGSLDEISIIGKTQVSQLKDGEVSTYMIEPEDFGMSRADLNDIRGGNVQKNAGIVLSVLKGEPGARRDMVLLNAAAALVAAGRAGDFPEGITLAAESIDSGRALEKLEGLKRVTSEYEA
jgi:anthranilate phosphoribosyltransferase